MGQSEMMHRPRAHRMYRPGHPVNKKTSSALMYAPYECAQYVCAAYKSVCRPAVGMDLAIGIKIADLISSGMLADGHCSPVTIQPDQRHFSHQAA
eukprot:363453-Chlamydomonas_euryale.AAC.9